MNLQAFELQGHRGARGLLPENTVPSMLLAVDLGVTALELDVLVSKDDKVLLSHDPALNPAHEFLPSAAAVEAAAADFSSAWYNLNYRDIRKFDVGSRFYNSFPEQQKLKVHKPLLSEVMESVEKHLQQQHLPPVLYNIELKSTPATDGKHHPAPEKFVALVLKVIRQQQLEHRVMLQSFDPRILEAVHAQQPGMKTGLLVENHLSFEENMNQLSFAPHCYNPWYKLVTPALLEACHHQGLKLITWTVNDLDEMKQLRQLGVDGIISDYPNLFGQL